MTTGVADAVTDGELSQARDGALNEVLRDITRGGVAGLIVGVLLAGLGGRFVMRLAALLVPEAVGRSTENGFPIGTITLGGTFTLTAFGLIFGILVGSLWVVISPWLPRSAPWRALWSIPIAVALGTFSLVDDGNRDFAILGRDPIVVASLVVLVASFGPALVLVDRWLDHRLPHADPYGHSINLAYLVVATLGTILTLLAVVPAFLGSQMVFAGVALVVVGICTFASWWLRVVRHAGPPRTLNLIGRSGLAAATVAGLLVATREISGALGAA
jgi:hypothetical protein